MKHSVFFLYTYIEISIYGKCRSQNSIYRKTKNPEYIGKINGKTKEMLSKSFETPKIFACGGLNKNTDKNNFIFS